MRYGLPIPYGWYCVGFSKDLEAGDVVPLQYFGEELVLFRTQSGEAAVLDAFCPHLGAHLGYGGKVEGESIACPFHGWQFDGTGACTCVPYAKQIPPRAQGGGVVRRYPVTESNGVIWAWYHPEAADPLWEVEYVPEFESDEWSDMEVHEWTINTIVQETGENAVDVAHFLYVHASTSMPAGDIVIEKHRRTTDIKMMTRAMDGFSEEEIGETQGHLISISIGPGQTVQHYDVFFKTTMMGTITPIDDQSIKLRFCFTQPAAATPEQQEMATGVREMMVFQVGQDVPIWENKKYLNKPLLCDSDGPINKYRKWFSQFYVDKT
jgi:phenylpropionate dioxygenase-like ring-hydroxylating dioxygenase large terminal subunit